MEHFNVCKLEVLSEVVNFVATTHPLGQKRCRRGDAYQIFPVSFYLRIKRLLEVEDFVRSTRRWLDRGKTREMQENGTPAR